MAVTKLSDIYIAEPFNAAVDQAATERNVFYQSGVMLGGDAFNSYADMPGYIGELPYWNALSDVEPNYSNDDDTTDSTPQNITSGKQIYRKAMMNQSWSTMDLTRELALTDPLGAITSKIGQYWATQIQKRVVQSALGVLADNVANDSGDMLYSVATDAAAAIAAAEKISATVVLTAKQTMGDAAESLSVIAMHSVVFTELQSQNLISYIPNARGEIVMPSYLGYRVVVDDGLPAVSGTNRITYTSILFGNGAFAWGSGTPNVASEMERKPAGGIGGGQDVVHSRRTDIIHPQGFQFLSASIAGQSASLAELAVATEWDRVFDRKNINMAFIQTNG